MQVHHKPVKILIGGKSGSGKTTYLIRYVRNSSFRRYFIFDHKSEFENRMGIEPCYEIEEAGKKLAAGEKHISYHYSDEYPGDVETAFQMFCEWSYEVCKAMEQSGDGKAGNSLFVCDEVNRFTTPSELGFGFKQLVEDGRLQGLDLVATSHAANQISNRLRLQLSEIVALKTSDERPLAFLEDSGFDPEEVSRLNRGAYIVKNMDTEVFTRGKLFTCTDNVDEVDDEQKHDKPTELTDEEENTTNDSEPNQHHAISQT